MKTFSNMSTPIMIITNEAYDLLWDKLTKRQKELEEAPGSQKDYNEWKEIKEKLNILRPLLVELAPLIL